MRMRFGIRPWAFGALVTGVFFRTAGVMLADPAPPADQCDYQKCEEKVWFVSSPSGNCFKFGVKECVWCWHGRCTKSNPQPKTTCLPFVNVKGKEEFIEHTPYPAGACSMLCDLSINKYTEAGAATKNPSDQASLVKKHHCTQPVNPPGGD